MDKGMTDYDALINILKKSEVPFNLVLAKDLNYKVSKADIVIEVINKRKEMEYWDYTSKWFFDRNGTLLEVINDEE